MCPQLSSVIDEDIVSKIIEKIDSSSDIIITTHLSPDGDAIGSSLALYHFIKNRGKKVKVIVPNSFPNFLKWLNGAKDIEVFEYNPSAGAHMLSKADLIFSLDYNVTKRVGEMAAHIENSSGFKILIDHHLHPGEGFDIRVSHPPMSSTSELIFRLIYQAGRYEDMTLEEAEAIYCGMMTDTGSFTYNSNSSEIYEIISFLIKKGVDKDNIHSKVFNNYSEERFRLLGLTLSERMEVYHDIHSALLYLSKEDQTKYNFKKGDTEGFVNYPLSIKDIIFSTFIREEDDLIKLSFRSQGEFPCNKFAADFFNGGGHLNASGGEFYGTLEDAINLYKEGIKKYENILKDSLPD
ncbi:MAG: DHH family phosphoesterase [Fermentimonas sp.]|jgi:phosphoesterase RecJ-like protein